MSRRTTGALLLAIAAFLFATRYLSAAIYGSAMNSWSMELFRNMFHNVGSGLTNWSMVTLVAGLLYLAWSEVDSIIQSRSRKKQKDKSQ